MAKYKCDFTAEDIADICTIVRLRKLQRNEDAFARMLNVRVELIQKCEEAKGQAYKVVFRKLVEKKLIRVKLEIEM